MLNEACYLKVLKISKNKSWSGNPETAREDKLMMQMSGNGNLYVLMKLKIGEKKLLFWKVCISVALFKQANNHIYIMQMIH